MAGRVATRKLRGHFAVIPGTNHHIVILMLAFLEYGCLVS